jgi:hypothetical protein
MMSVIKKIIRGLVLLTALAIILVWASDFPPPEYRLAALLRIPELPRSVSDVQCWSRGMQDDETQCTGVAAPSEMSLLMKGYSFGARFPELPIESRSAACGDLPESSERATHCHIYRSSELGLIGGSIPGHMAFNYNETSGRFQAETLRNSNKPKQ